MNTSISVQATGPEADFTEISAALNVSPQAVQKRSIKEGWAYREQTVRGGKKRLFPISSLPKPVRETLQTARLSSIQLDLFVSSSGANTTHTAAAPALSGGTVTTTTVAAGLSIPCADLTDAQRQERDARTGIVAAIHRFQAKSGCSQEAAITTLLTLARTGNADPIINNALRLARDPRGRAGDGLPSVRTIKRWLSAKDLAPKAPKADMSIPPWAATFLRLYQVPQKPSVDSAYADACHVWNDQERPSIHQVRRFLGKLGTVTRERGRMGPRELKNIQPFIRRSFDQLEPNDVWSADGHTFDAEVQHPLHGRPFRPEITSIIDIATRRVTGWSVDLAESGLAVVDAIRYGVTRVGIPAIFYVDNGSGYKNAMMLDETTGLMGRLRISMENSLPYNSQARGVIERLHQTLWVTAAKQLPSYIGAAMDREARLEQFKLSRKALKSGGTMPLIPWDVFVAFVEDKVAAYNARPHRTLKGSSPDLVWRAFELRGWNPESVTDDAIATLFRPRVTRVIQRGEINLFGNRYFSRELTEFHGTNAQIAYDIHDPMKVWVYTPEGRLICEAEADGNRRHYFPVPVVQQARERRAKGRLARVDAKREEILEELHGAPAIAAPAGGQIVIGGRVIDAEAISSILSPREIQAQRALPTSADEMDEKKGNLVQSPAQTSRPRSERTPAENYTDWLDIDRRVLAGDPVSDDDARWHRTYPNSAQYRAEAGKRKAAA